MFHLNHCFGTKWVLFWDWFHCFVKKSAQVWESQNDRDCFRSTKFYSGANKPLFPCSPCYVWAFQSPLRREGSKLFSALFGVQVLYNVVYWFHRIKTSVFFFFPELCNLFPQIINQESIFSKTILHTYGTHSFHSF